MTVLSNLMPAFGMQHPVELSGEINSSKVSQDKQEKEVHLYSKKWTGGKKYLGTANLNFNNHFNFNYTSPVSFSKTHDISLEIFERHRPFASHGLPGYRKLRPLGKATIKLDDRKKQKMVLTDAQIQTLTHVDQPIGKNRPNIAYFARLLLAGIPEIIKATITSLFSSRLTVDKVQRLYNSFGRQFPYSEPTLPNLINDLQNSICAIDFKKKGDQIKWEANWDDYEFDIEKSLPNVTVKARKEEDSIIIESIQIQFRGGEKQVIIPEQATPEELKLAIYITRSTFALKGESEKHLAEGHLLPGIIAHSFLKFISQINPLYDVVARYLQNLEFINWLGGNGIIFGKGSVIEASALTDRSVAELIIRCMNEKADFLNYRPIEPLSSNHHRAIVGKVHYNTLKKYFSDFIDENWEKIVPFKEEIFQWSENMHEKLESIPKIMSNRENFSKEIEGKKLALSLASLVNQTTFLHWSSHARQEILTHVDLASLCLGNSGRGPDGLPIKFGNTPIEAANIQLKTSRTLLKFKAHKFVNYAHPELLKRILPLRDKYLTFPLDEMFVSTEI